MRALQNSLGRESVLLNSGTASKTTDGGGKGGVVGAKYTGGGGDTRGGPGTSGDTGGDTHALHGAYVGRSMSQPEGATPFPAKAAGNALSAPWVPSARRPSAKAPRGTASMPQLESVEARAASAANPPRGINNMASCEGVETRAPSAARPSAKHPRGIGNNASGLTVSSSAPRLTSTSAPARVSSPTRRFSSSGAFDTAGGAYAGLYTGGGTHRAFDTGGGPSAGMITRGGGHPAFGARGGFNTRGGPSAASDTGGEDNEFSQLRRMAETMYLGADESPGFG